MAPMRNLGGLLLSLPLKPRETPLLPAAQTLGCLA